ncbi:MAG: hypothetical protein CMJ91_01525, partial [Planctomycetes bacterium]|nr:hypothetical protein [Planctomycetota bacterium]
APLTLELAADESSPPPSLEITLLSGCSLRGSFNNPVVEGRHEHLRLVGKGLLRKAWPDKDRSYLFEGLPPGNYTLLHFANAKLIGAPMEIRIEAGAKEVLLDINGD